MKPNICTLRNMNLTLKRKIETPHNNIETAKNKPFSACEILIDILDCLDNSTID
jgi:hypothetical protein